MVGKREIAKKHILHHDIRSCTQFPIGPIPNMQTQMGLINVLPESIRLESDPKKFKTEL